MGLTSTRSGEWVVQTGAAGAATWHATGAGRVRAGQLRAIAARRGKRGRAPHGRACAGARRPRCSGSVGAFGSFGCAEMPVAPVAPDWAAAPAGALPPHGRDAQGPRRAAGRAGALT